MCLIWFLNLRYVPNAQKCAKRNVPIAQKGGEKSLKSKKVMFIIFVIALLLFVFLMKDNLLKIMYPRTYEEEIKIYQEKYQVEANLILAVIKAESDFNKDAISHKRAIGLMQLMEETAKDVARKNKIALNTDNVVEELCQVDKNIEIGTCYLATLLQRYENKEVALAAYNAGIGTVDRMD